MCGSTRLVLPCLTCLGWLGWVVPLLYHGSKRGGLGPRWKVVCVFACGLGEGVGSQLGRGEISGWIGETVGWCSDDSSCLVSGGIPSSVVMDEVDIQSLGHLQVSEADRVALLLTISP